MSPARIRPDFIVIGAMRAATTTLYRYLGAHPRIGMSREKETDFFVESLNFGRGPAWYAGLFPDGFDLYGEVSPNYTKQKAFPGVAERIATHNPDCRLLYVVRDPLARAISHYKFVMATGNSPECEPDWDNILDASRYCAQLNPYLTAFGADRVLVVDFDQLRDNPQAALDGIATFLGLPQPWPLRDATSVNSATELGQMPQWFFRLRRLRWVSDLRRALPHPVQNGLRRILARGATRAIPDPPPERIAWLRGELGPDTAAFRALTGRDFAHWSV